MGGIRHVGSVVFIMFERLKGGCTREEKEGWWDGAVYIVGLTSVNTLR